MNVISWSGGKDSTATVILAHEHNEPVDKIIFSEVMFSRRLSGELPEHMEFVHKAMKTFREWGYEVEIVRSEYTYLDCFFNVIRRSKSENRNGKINGFPMAMRCCINRDCKLRPLDQFDKDNPDVTYYVGIAVDEPKRLERAKGKNQISLLEKYGYTEQMAYELCEKYDLLSPTYSFSKRGGCWFCPNARDRKLRHLYDNHNELWQILLNLEKMTNMAGYCFNTLSKTRIVDKDEQFRLEDAQISIDEFLGKEPE